MPTIETTIAFFGLSLLLGFSPGPDNIFVLMQSATRGRKAGLIVVLGLCTGLLVHTAAVALGLAAIFAASVTAFTVLKFLGAAYLAYLAWQAFRAPDGDNEEVAAQGSGYRRMYLRGVIMNLTNPKVGLFFLALLPQFVEADRGPVVLQLCWLGFVFILATLVSFGATTWFASLISRRLRESPKARRVMNRLSGVVFAGLAARVAMTER